MGKPHIFDNQDVVLLLSEAVSDPVLMPETRIALIYGVVIDNDYDYTVDNLMRDMHFSKYKSRKVIKELKDIGILKISDIKSKEVV